MGKNERKLLLETSIQEDAVRKRIADEEAARKRAVEECTRKKIAEEEAARKRQVEESTCKRLADEETARKRNNEERLMHAAHNQKEIIPNRESAEDEMRQRIAQEEAV